MRTKTTARVFFSLTGSNNRPLLYHNLHTTPLSPHTHTRIKHSSPHAHFSIDYINTILHHTDAFHTHRAPAPSFLSVGAVVVAYNCCDDCFFPLYFNHFELIIIVIIIHTLTNVRYFNGNMMNNNDDQTSTTNKYIHPRHLNIYWK